MLSISVSGNRLHTAKAKPIGTRKIVAKREISIVSLSDLMVMISAEKNMKYAKK
jgi:hypothetical protein